MAFLSCTPFAAADATQSSLNSGIIDGMGVYAMSVQAFASASNTSTVKVQGSNDQAGSYSPGPMNSAGTGVWAPSHWTDIASASITLAGTTPAAVEFSFKPYRWYRLVYTKASTPTGTFTAT